MRTGSMGCRKDKSYTVQHVGMRTMWRTINKPQDANAISRTFVYVREAELTTNPLNRTERIKMITDHAKRRNARIFATLDKLNEQETRNVIDSVDEARVIVDGLLMNLDDIEGEKELNYNRITNTLTNAIEQLKELRTTNKKEDDTKQAITSFINKRSWER